MSIPEIIGAIGVFLLLLAYLLNVLKVTGTDGITYLLLNVFGAGLACYSSWLISFIPFIVLEGVWALVSLVSLVKVLAGSKS